MCVCVCERYPSLNRGWRDKKKIGIWRAIDRERGGLVGGGEGELGTGVSLLLFLIFLPPSASRNEEEEEPRQGSRRFRSI